MKVFLTLLVLGIAGYEILGMVSRKQNKEIVLFIGIGLLSLALGYYYLSNPFRPSLAENLLKILGEEFNR